MIANNDNHSGQRRILWNNNWLRVKMRERLGEMKREWKREWEREWERKREKERERKIFLRKEKTKRKDGKKSKREQSIENQFKFKFFCKLRSLWTIFFTLYLPSLSFFSFTFLLFSSLTLSRGSFIYRLYSSWVFFVFITILQEQRQDLWLMNWIREREREKPQFKKNAFLDLKRIFFIASLSFFLLVKAWKPIDREGESSIDDEEKKERKRETKVTGGTPARKKELAGNETLF